MAEEVNFKKNRKRLPNFILLPLFLVILGGICAFLLSLTNELTKEAIEENTIKAAAAEAEEIKSLLKDEYGLVDINNIYDPSDNYRYSDISSSEVKDEDKELIDNLYSEVELLSGRGDDSCNYEVNAVFYCKDAENNVFMAFKVLHTNNFTTVTTIVVIEVSTLKVSHVQVIGKATTLGAAKDNAFLARDEEWNVNGKGESEYRSSFSIISGSTYSSKSVKNSIKYAYNQLNAYKVRENVGE